MNAPCDGLRSEQKPSPVHPRGWWGGFQTRLYATNQPSRVTVVARDRVYDTCGACDACGAWDTCKVWVGLKMGEATMQLAVRPPAGEITIALLYVE